MQFYVSPITGAARKRWGVFAHLGEPCGHGRCIYEATTEAGADHFRIALEARLLALEVAA